MVAFFCKSLHFLKMFNCIATQSRTEATRGPVLLQSLLSLLEGRQETGIRVGKDSATGELSFPDSGLYGEYLDQESWFDWQSR